MLDHPNVVRLYEVNEDAEVRGRCADDTPAPAPGLTFRPKRLKHSASELERVGFDVLIRVIWSFITSNRFPRQLEGEVRSLDSVDSTRRSTDET